MVDQIYWYERWALGIELALAFNVALVVALSVYLLCTKTGCDLKKCLTCCARGQNRSPNYHNLISQSDNPSRTKATKLNAQYTDCVTETTKIRTVISSDEEI